MTVDSILDGDSVWPTFGLFLNLCKPYIGFHHQWEINRPIISYEEFLAAATGQELQHAFQFSGDFGDLFAGVS